MIKKTLLIALVLLFLSINGWAQDTTSRIKARIIDTATLTTGIISLGDTLFLSGLRFVSADSTVDYKRKLDTVKVLMLVCDTNEQYHVWDTFEYDSAATKRHYDSLPITKSLYGGGMIGKFMKDTTNRHYSEYVYWKFGYKVMKFIPAGWGEWDNQIFPHWEFENYLDDKKQPLKSGIIVWQSVPEK